MQIKIRILFQLIKKIMSTNVDNLGTVRDSWEQLGTIENSWEQS